MDWIRAIEINRAVLVRIVAALVAIVEGYGGAQWVPDYVHRSVVRLLRPAESAVRRLIVIAARKLVVPAGGKPPAVRPWPKGLKILRKDARKRRASFRLFDPIRPFVDYDAEEQRQELRNLPAIRVTTSDPLVPGFLRGVPPAARFNSGTPQGFVSVRMIARRLEAARSALDDIPREARRLMRCLTRDGPQPRRLVLRPGPPPGNVKRSDEDVHLVLKECHALARHALSDSS